MKSNKPNKPVRANKEAQHSDWSPPVLHTRCPVKKSRFTQSTKKQQKSRQDVNTNKQSARNSTARYRQKKRIELCNLENNVKELEEEIVAVDKAIWEVKSKICGALEMLADRSKDDKDARNGPKSVGNGQNIQIYNQLEYLIGKSSKDKINNFAANFQHSQYQTSLNLIQPKQSNLQRNILLKPSQSVQQQPLPKTDQLVDIDKINLLLDTLKYRLGANGRQRQSRLDYLFKSIVNTIFPALYRYMLFSNVENVDIFACAGQDNGSLGDKIVKIETGKNEKWKWTKQFFENTSFYQHQIRKFKQQFSQKLYKVFQETITGIKKLNQIIIRLKQQGLKIQNIEQHYRQILNPIQSAYSALFTQRYRYRKQLMLDERFCSMDLNLNSYNLSQKLDQIRKQLYDKQKQIEMQKCKQKQKYRDIFNLKVEAQLKIQEEFYSSHNNDFYQDERQQELKACLSGRKRVKLCKEQGQ